MQVVVLWEDQRGAQAKGFGPHELLLSCLADDGVGTRNQVRSSITTTKPTPDERDRLLSRLAWGSLKVRTETRNDCPSFDRLVRHVASVFPEPLT
jgi:hypothetical protein